LTAQIVQIGSRLTQLGFQILDLGKPAQLGDIAVRFRSEPRNGFGNRARYLGHPVRTENEQSNDDDNKQFLHAGHGQLAPATERGWVTKRLALSPSNHPFLKAYGAVDSVATRSSGPFTEHHLEGHRLAVANNA